MSKYKFLLRKGIAAVMLAAVAGCYSYKEPAVATLGESYSARAKDKSDEIFKNMTLLTLRDAQRIAIKNNPTYIAAFHSMEAARMKYLQAWGAYSPTINASYTLQNGRSWTTRDTSRTGWADGQTPHSDSFSQSMGVSANLLIFVTARLIDDHGMPIKRNRVNGLPEYNR